MRVSKARLNRRTAVIFLSAHFLLLGQFTQLVAQEQLAAAQELMDLSIEDLMKVEVTTATRMKERRSDSAAAVTVLTQEDIRRSGATSIPEVLRLAPGVQVARLDGNKWSVTARGFGGRFANKMLVLVDGVSIYSPLFSGTFWEVENVLLEDIERIEIVRGPGGSSWGANAVNGVINIITFPASKTGNLMRVGAGTEDKVRVGARVSEQVSENLALRVSGNYMDRGTQRRTGGGEAFDDYDTMSTQFRLDWTPPGPDHLTLQAKAFHGTFHETYQLGVQYPPFSAEVPDESYVEQGNLMLQWTHAFDEDDKLQVRAYVDHWRNDSVIILDERQVADLEIQRQQVVGNGHDIVYGIGVRHVRDDIQAEYAYFDPRKSEETTYSAFMNAGLWAVPEKLRFVLGVRMEVNDYTGFEMEPTLRAVWTPNEKHTLWGAVSRAVRVPARGETDIFLPSFAGPGVLAALDGNPDMDSESMISYELGYRYFPRPTLALESTLFFSNYDKLRTLELSTPYLDLWNCLPTLVIPAMTRNNLDATTIGGSVSMDWRPKEWWRLRTSYSYIDLDLELKTRGIDLFTLEAEGDVPRHIVTVWNAFELSERVSLDAIVQYVDELPTLRVEDYFDATVRLSWRPNDAWELSLAGKNLLAPSKLQYRSSLLNTLPSEIQRAVYAEASWSF